MSETLNLNPEFQQRLSQLYTLREKWENAKKASPILRDSNSDMDKMLDLAIEYTTSSVNLPADTSVEELERMINTLILWFPPTK